MHPCVERRILMNTFTARLHRFARITVASLSLVLLLSICWAEGWGAVGKPPSPAIVNSTYIIYVDGSELTATGTYTTGGVAYTVPPAVYDDYDDLWYSD